MFRQIKDQDAAIEVLKHAIHSDHVGQAYLFYGPEGVGKFTTALYFAMALNCVTTEESRPCGICHSCQKFLQFNHPDFVYIFPNANMKISEDGNITESKQMAEYHAYLANKKDTPWKEFFFSSNAEIRLDNIHYLQHRLSISINEARYRVCLVENADWMNNQTANAFLKTLEEPPPNTVIILTTTQPSALLPTILSRCQSVRFQPLPSYAVEQVLVDKLFLSKVEAKTYARIANGNLKHALRLGEQGKSEARNFMIRFMDMVLAQDDFAFLQFLGDVKGNHSSAFYSDVITYVNVLLGDLAFFQDAHEYIVNVDLVPMLEHCFQANPMLYEEIPRMTEALEKLRLQVEGNVNPQLILIGMYHLFQGSIFGKSQVSHPG